MPRFLSFDISTVGTGWCAYTHPGHFEMGVLRFDKKAELPEKLLGLHERSDDLINKFSPDIVIVEGVFAYRNVKVTKILSEAAASVKLNCYKQDIPVFIIENTTVKSFFGTRKKEDLYNLVTNLTGMGAFDLKFDDANDMVDAFALMLYYLDAFTELVTFKADDSISFLEAKYEKN